MILARCPECRRMKVTIKVPGAGGEWRQIRSHHVPDEIDLLKRIKGPVCTGSGRKVHRDDSSPVLR